MVGISAREHGHRARFGRRRSFVLTVRVLLAGTSCAQGGPAYHVRPRYERVDAGEAGGEPIETVWQRPASDAKGIFFIAHGCNHQGTDIFSEVGPDGWRFAECATSNFGRCLGLPEETRLVRAARSRGYLVMAVSGGSGSQSCWDMDQDGKRVAAAIGYVRTAEGLPVNTPILAMGASSGGAFMGVLAAPLADGGLEHLRCIVPQIMSTSFPNRGVPTLFVHMPRDTHTAARVRQEIAELKGLNVRVSEIGVEPVPVTEELLGRCMSADKAKKAVEALGWEDLVDAKGFLTEDARARQWVSALEIVMGPNRNDTLEPDESCVAELMNVAWARHEFTSQYAEMMLDFCEEKGAFSSTGSQHGYGDAENKHRSKHISSSDTVRFGAAAALTLTCSIIAFVACAAWCIRRSMERIFFSNYSHQPRRKGQVIGCQE